MPFRELIRLHMRTILSSIRDARTFLNFGLVVLVAFLMVNYAFATTPNPGHPWTDVGDGVFIFSNGQTVTPYTYTFPTANSTVLTTNALITAAQGGTGLSTFGGANTVLYTSAADTLTNVAASAAAGQFLQTTASGGAPTWATILGVANGGTGLASFTANNLMYGAGTSAASLLAPGATTGAVLMNTAAGPPGWSLLSALPSTAGILPLANGGTNASLVASNGGIVYSSASALAILAGNGTAGKILQSGANAAPTWSTATFPATAGTSGNILMSNGTNWTSAANPAATPTVSAFVGRAFTATGAVTALATASLTAFNIGMVNIPAQITVNQMTFTVGTVTTAGTMRLCVYNEAGTNLISKVSGTPVAGANNVTVSPAVVLPPGNYYVAMGCATTCSNTISTWTTTSVAGINAATVPTGKKVYEGTGTMTSGTCNATLPAITAAVSKTPIFRLDN